MSDRNWRVDATSNFNDETYCEKTLDLPPLREMEADKICEILNQAVGGNDPTYYTPRPKDAGLWRGMEDLV